MRGRTRNDPAGTRHSAASHTRWAWVLVALGLWALLPASPGAADDDVTQERLIEVLYDDALPVDGLDANTDGALTVADVLVLTPRPTPSPTPSPSPTATAVGTLYDGTIAELIPHGVGDILYYKVTDGFGQVATGTARTISSDANGVFRVIDGFIDNQGIPSDSEETTYLDTVRELYLTGVQHFAIGDSVSCTTTLDPVGLPGLLHLKLPIIAGQTFTTKARCAGGFGSGGLNYLRTDSFTPVEIVDQYTVPAGTYTNVLHVTGSISQAGFPLELDDIYIAPGVGVIYQIARAQAHLILKRELTDGTIGGHPVKRP